MSRSRTLHLVGNAHLDAAWLWQWPEAFQAAKATFRSALDRIREYPEFIFSASSAAFHEWVERSDPAMFEEIRQAVADGRWELVGGWWVEPDCNLPSGESLVRQAVVGQRYFLDRFGRAATVGFNPDSFGHAAQIPQILRGAGLAGYCFMRPEPWENPLPRVFRWTAPDGSSVLAYRIPFEYCAPRIALDEQLGKVIGALESPADGEWSERMMFYGVGNHGGGPTKANLDSLRRLAANSTGEGQPSLRHSTPAVALESIASNGETVVELTGDLLHHSRGCYSAHSEVKQTNRRAAAELVTAETLASLASRALGRPYARDFEQAWRNVLFNQFHDILGGTSIEPVYDDARAMHGEALSVARRATNDAVQAMSWAVAIPLRPETTPIVVVNPHPWAIRALVETEFGRLEAGAGLVDETGVPLGMQRIRSRAAVSPGHGRNRLLFPLELPPGGWRTVHVTPLQASRDGQADAGSSVRADASTLTLTNEHLVVRLDRATGAIASLVDHALDVDLAAAPLGALDVRPDRSDTWSHGLGGYDGRPVRRFRARSIRLVEDGPVRATFRVVATLRRSTFVTEISLSAGERAVDVAARLDWHEVRHVGKLRFPLAFVGARLTVETPYAESQRPADGTEQPGGRWADVSGRVPDGRDAGLLFVNDAKSAFDARASNLGVTVVRSPFFAHHDPYVPDDEAAYRAIDQGEQPFRFRLMPHDGDRHTLGPARRADELLVPPIPLVETFHDGPLAQRGSWLSVEPEHVILGACKAAEDGDGLVLRLVETAGAAADACVRLLGRDIPVRLDPWKIVTLRVPDDPDEPVVPTDLLERPL